MVPKKVSAAKDEASLPSMAHFNKARTRAHTQVRTFLGTTHPRDSNLNPILTSTLNPRYKNHPKCPNFASRLIIFLLNKNKNTHTSKNPT